MFFQGISSYKYSPVFQPSQSKKTLKNVKINLQNTKTMKIIGAGYGRTGTKSLQIALEKLGYGNCYHMEKLLRNPADVILWRNAYEEKEVDWNALFQKYQAIVDFPGSIYYKELVDFYPESKVILTVRDPEKWYDSVDATIFSFDPGPLLKLKMLLKMPFSATARNLFQVIQLNDKIIWKKYFQGKFQDRGYVIKKYQQHIEEVKQVIPADRLLIYEVKEGWQPLCEFLNKEIPKEAFPNSNKQEDFHKWATNIVKEVIEA